MLFYRLSIASLCISTAGSYSQYTVHVATNYSLALNISVCLNKSLGWDGMTLTFLPIWEASAVNSINNALGDITIVMWTTFHRSWSRTVELGSLLQKNDRQQIIVWHNSLWSVKHAHLLLLTMRDIFLECFSLQMVLLLQIKPIKSTLSLALLSGCYALLLWDCTQTQPPECGGEIPPPCWPYG